MSTISTHLNWGSSYISLDFYKRFVKPDASEKELVGVGRLSTLILMVLAALLALQFESALSTFNILLQIGAGTGLIFILRWFWWRINAYSEITGMIVSFVLAVVFELNEWGLADHEKLVLGVLITTLAWVSVTLLTKPTDTHKLVTFYNKITPYGRGWNGFKQITTNMNIHLDNTKDNFTIDLASMLLGIVFVYSALFGSGYLLYGNWTGTMVLYIIALASAYFVFRFWKKSRK